MKLSLNPWIGKARGRCGHKESALRPAIIGFVEDLIDADRKDTFSEIVPQLAARCRRVR
jgi:hypothetical protein